MLPDTCLTGYLGKMNGQSWKFVRFHNWLFFLVVALWSTGLTVRAQFLYKTVSGAVTITGYTGPGGTVIIPATIEGLPVTAIGSAAFLGNPKVINVTIDDSVRSIGMQAFQHCIGLMTVSIGKGVTSIGNDAFDSCNNLTNVMMSDGVTSLGENAFSGCASLASVRTPSFVTSISDQAFQGCSNLTSITIGSSVTNLGNNAFENCTGFASIYFQGDAPAYKACVFCGDSVKVYYLPGTSGWGPTFAGRPTKLWDPQAQTTDESFGLRRNRFGFNIAGAADIPLVVEASNDLGARSWVPLQACTLTNGLIYFSDVHWTNYTGRFYRIRSP